MDFKRKMTAFRAYALVDTGTSNDNKPRAVSVIALKVSNNAGGHYFMSLNSDRIIHGFKLKELSIDEHVIQRVKALAEEEEKHVIRRGNPRFEWAPGIEIENIFEEENEPTLMIANDIHHEEALDQHMLETETNEDEEESYVLNENLVDVEDREEIDIPENKKTIIVPENSIVSEEDTFVK